MTHERLAVVAQFGRALTMETAAPSGPRAPRSSPTASSWPPLAPRQLHSLLEAATIFVRYGLVLWAKIRQARAAIYRGFGTYA
jgi:hypothetical protein